MNKNIITTVGLTAAGMLLLAGCVQNQPEGEAAAGNALTVNAKAESCEVSAATAKSGNVTFEITNEGDQTTEFYLLGADGLRIAAEKENIAPGSSTNLTVSLQPGDYFTACKPGMRGANIGEAAFTVTGDPVELEGEDQELLDQVVVDYMNFVKNEVAELVPNVEAFANAYIDGDDDKAKELYANIRVNYERIEPIAEALGLLDPRIDYREIDYLAEAELLEADDPSFTEWLGFHRIEKDLWVPAKDAVQPDGEPAWDGWKPSTPEERKVIGETLIEDSNRLYDAVHSDTIIEEQQMNVGTVSNGASGLLEEIAVGKVTGEENWWSHYDLWDFQANLQGSRIAFDLVAPIAERKGAEGTELVKQINTEFDALQKLLDGYGNLDDGYVLYNEVTDAQQKELVAQIDALREPLSKLTGTVLGIEEA
ncbi:iron uptake system protein EfeO [Leucobacter chinensis]|uniref:iron uptake system protein EfeO n=1 Tax=Leucobacter chinensis TaxID=2851010 RepID=UPI001C23D1DA|nr:iron uptake system protein EfeO [Leucobacter chinensis]